MPRRPTPNLECILPIAPIGKTPAHLYLGKAVVMINQALEDYSNAVPEMKHYRLVWIPSRKGQKPYLRWRVRAERVISKRVIHRGTGWRRIVCGP